MAGVQCPHVTCPTLLAVADWTRRCRCNVRQRISKKRGTFHSLVAYLQCNKYEIEVNAQSPEIFDEQAAEED